MAHVDLKQLVGKLNRNSRAALEAAAGLCLSRTNYNVEIEHWLLKLLEQTNTDFVVLLRQFGVDQSRLAADLTRAIDRFKTGNSRPPSLSPDLVELVREAWLIGSIDYGATMARSGHLLCALLGNDALRRIATGASAEFDKVRPDALHAKFPLVLPKTD